MCENRTDKCQLKPFKQLENKLRGPFNYKYDANREVLFLIWNDNKRVKLGKNFDNIRPLGSDSR